MSKGCSVPILSVQTFMCACLQCVFAACYFSTLPKCCDESDLQIILPSGLKEIIRRTPHPPEKKEKKIKIEKSPWYQLWLYCMCKLIDSLTYLWDVFWKFYVLVCLFVRLFVQFFSVSLCQRTNTDALSCHLNPVT